jgi:large conductance mechanosensitive channel
VDQLKVWFDGFKKFLMRGNVIDLAIAFVIGGAFAVVVKAMVSDLLLPIVTAVIGKPDFGSLTFTIHESVFRYGDLIDQVIYFVSVAAAIYFLVVQPMAMIEARRSGPSVAATTRTCPECLSDIPMKATRCAFCTTVVVPVA